MIGTEFLKGQGLGNQLFCYVTTRAIAEEKGYRFGTANQKQFANNIHSNRGMYFMDVDLGYEITETDKERFKRYDEAELRLYIGNSKHDLEHGCYISGADKNVMNIADNTLLYGNLQDESYFGKYQEQIRQWLHIRPEYDSYEFSRDNLCIINMRGGEYTGSPELLIDRKYWLKGMKNMKAIRPDMEFMIVTDDVKTAERILPGIPAYHFDMGKDFVTIKNARYLLLSNSSFACFAAFISETVQYVIAPKYWARYNVSDGYWASEQNIYQGWHYQDRKGKLFSDEECRHELEQYKLNSLKYRGANRKSAGIKLSLQKLRSRMLSGKYYCLKRIRGIGRRIKRMLHFAKTV